MHELAAREAIPHLTDEHLAAMAVAAERFEQALADGDVEAAIASDDAFHAVFVDLCANRILTGVLTDVTPLLRRMERVRFASLGGRSSVAQHRRIIELARAGDVEGGAQETRRNWLTLQPPQD
jgi:DNA-binding GntR family transcriptional regulator